ncbi:hypothetical protein MIND_00172000 [Mycena indigotica]|uniref:Uncharacterized protein n=1 Tax=Mycena indigotica TaxID=2126181 RepID=A0A8H6TGY2_9AGAR|nr:uncharacterized protein MIND_00172000 [Mycena indigotica]KAF7316527.1 hypothetical protein MIND_00172000 [Mycena indigotica]
MARPQALQCLVLCLLIFATLSYGSVNFPQCFSEIRNGDHGLDGLTDNNGNPTTDLTRGTAVTYKRCVEVCGGGGGAFSWSSFSQQFSAWLLPWLALLSQFPFGCRERWDNFMSIFLALGSPCLAAYSLALTILNVKWVVHRFHNVRYPNKDWAIVILSNLQHMPLKVTRSFTAAINQQDVEYPLLASLIVLPDNDAWWEKLERDLNYADPHTWSIASVSSIAWVIVAYTLTVVDAFTTVSSDPNENGQGLSGVGSIWLWMIPVTIGYLQLSPRCDANRVEEVLTEANRNSFVAGSYGSMDVPSGERAITIQRHTQHQALHADQVATAPIYNYARFLSFVHAVEGFACAFDAATDKAHNRIPVSGGPPAWRPGDGKTVHADNRRGNNDQIEEYCSPLPNRSHWGSGVFTRFFVAALAGLVLQWGTSGGSIVIVYYTPTVGFGCRSTAYLVYAGFATLIWITLVVSSFLAHYAMSYRFTNSPTQPLPQTIAEQLSIFLRRVAKVGAMLNAVWILVAFLLQFSNFYDRCYCNSDVIGLGKRAHNVMVLLAPDISNMKAAWVGGIALAVVVTVAWWIFITLMSNPPPRPYHVA